MLALYRCGRQADALAAFRRARASLVEQLGIESARELRELHQQILNQDSALDLPAGNRVEAGPATATGGTLVGRGAELGCLLAALDEAFAGNARVVLVSGEPGIGKTRLVDEFASHARRRGAHVLVGRCWEAGGAPPFWPFGQALRSYVHARDPELVRRQLGPGAAELVQLLPELKDVVPDLPAPSSLEPEAARFRLFDAVASFLRSAADEQPIMLFLDDLHAADAPSLLLLQFVARSLADCPVIVVAAYRDVDPPLEEPLTTTLAELLREPVTRRLSLAGLGELDVASFIEQISGQAPPEQLTDEIHRVTEGNPLFVGEIVRLLVTEGALDHVTATSRGNARFPKA